MKKILTDGADIVAKVAYKFSQVVPVYPITPSTPMAEKASTMAERGEKNILGQVVKKIEMQSEAGVSGTLHGALLSGATGTTFTSSQGLLLMIPNMFKMAGENLPAVIHVSARSVATHALNIFCDHSDVMATRMTGFNMICSSNVQESQDMAFCSHALALSEGGATLHFFDGFRTSHEISKICPLNEKMYLPYIEVIKSHNKKFANDNSTYGSAQNPDTFFQGRENTTSLHMYGLKEKFEKIFSNFAKDTGRKYNFFEYYGSPDAENIVVCMGSACETIEEYIDQNDDKKIGLIKTRVYRPFYEEEFLKIMPKSTKKICVLDRTKEVGSENPLALDVMATLQKQGSAVKVITGRYGLGGKDFTPAHVNAVFKNMEKENSLSGFAVGINSLMPYICTLPVEEYQPNHQGQTQIKIFGLGSDGSVSASKSTITILGETLDSEVQGYFEYDSKKSGSLTKSHLRLSDKKIKSQYLTTNPNIISINNFSFVHRYNCLEGLQKNSIVVINSIFDGQEIDKVLPEEYVTALQKCNSKLFVINAQKIAQECGLGDKINIIMQTALLKVANFMPENEFVAKIEEQIRKTFARKGQKVIDKNIYAMKMSLSQIQEVDVKSLKGKKYKKDVRWDDKFYQEIMLPIERMEGDKILAEKIFPSSPIGTSKYEKRAIASLLPKWIKENCIQCGQCVLSCPHSALRALLVEGEEENEDFRPAIGLKGKQYRIQLSPEDCTGCGVCASTCPALQKALKMVSAEEILDEEKVRYQKSFDYKKSSQSLFSTDHAKGLQFEKPYFEFSGACAGCGETPYIKLASTLFKDKMVIANATGCSSIYAGSYASCPFVKDENGNGIKWANSLFEDNAEFGLGLKLGGDFTQKEGKSVWIIGGDGWAYDIGFGGLDHVLASGENVNILVLDNESYSNTGGQSSKATPKGANVKLAEAGKRTHKKNLGQIAMGYKDVYVAQVAFGANMSQCIKAFKEAEAYPGTSIIIAYCTCVNQGFDLAKTNAEEKKAVEVGYWPLYRYHPNSGLTLDSEISPDGYFDFLKGERRYAITIEQNKEELLSEQKERAIENYQTLAKLANKEES